MVKLLHLSDIHANAPFMSKRQEVRDALKEGLMISFENAVQFAVNEDFDAILIAGDFLDHDYVEYKVESRLLATIKKALAHDVHIFYCTGNHDPLSHMALFKELKDIPNFHVFEHDIIEKVQCVSKKGILYSVVGCGHKSKFEKRNLIKSFPQKETDELVIGIAHASVHSVKSVEEKEKYLPTTLSDIKALNYHYFALGHIHLRQFLTEKIAYSGNIQGLSIKETGSRGGIICDISAQTTLLKEIDFNDISWTQIDLDVDENQGTLRALEVWMMSQIVEIINRMNAPAIKQIIRIHLKGRSSLYGVLNDESNLHALEEGIRNALGLLDLEIEHDQINRAVDMDVLRNETTVLAEALNALFSPENHLKLLERLESLELTTPLRTHEETVDWIKNHHSTLINELIDRMVIDEHDH